METLVWAIKNGDLDQVQEKLGEQVRYVLLLSDKRSAVIQSDDKTVTHTPSVADLENQRQCRWEEPRPLRRRLRTGTRLRLPDRQVGECQCECV